MNKHTQAYEDAPITVYYCKAQLTTGRTVRVLLADGRLFNCRGVRLLDVRAEMMHDNSKGKPKNSGARVVLKVSAGEVEMVDPKEDKA